MAALTGFGLGGQIPIDATITLEFLPQNKRYLVALLSLWQPIGVVVACAIAYGLVPRYRCDTSLPSCMVTTSGVPCCSKSDNMGWRYLMITLGGLTLTVFFLRFIVFNFRESPKYLLGKGKEQEAIDVLHSIAKFNRAPPPTLTLEDFAAIDQEMSVVSDPVSVTPLKTKQHAKVVLMDGLGKLRHLKGLFRTPLMAFTTIIIWIAYMGDFWSEHEVAKPYRYGELNFVWCRFQYRWFLPADYSEQPKCFVRANRHVFYVQAVLDHILPWRYWVCAGNACDPIACFGTKGQFTHSAGIKLPLT